jgi:hypothetical protein
MGSRRKRVFDPVPAAIAPRQAAAARGTRANGLSPIRRLGDFAGLGR